MCNTARVDGKIALADRFAVADGAVDHEAAQPAFGSPSNHDFTDDGIAHVATRVDHDHVARLSGIDGLVHHQVVARPRAHRVGAAQDAAGAVHGAQGRCARAAAHCIADVGHCQSLIGREGIAAGTIGAVLQGKSELRHGALSPG
ncbi:hypothetical protein D3C72_1975870 [compost metagenome]